MQMSKGDYQILETILLLKALRDAGDERGFAIGLKTAWDKLKDVMPEEVQNRPQFLILDLYFRYHGDIDKMLERIQKLLSKAQEYEAVEEIARTRVEFIKSIFLHT